MNIVERIISVVAPHDCIVCGNEGSLLCDGCRLAVLSPVPGRCYRCKAADSDSTTCAKCRRHSSLRHVWVATEYEGVAKELVQRLKFGRAVAASEPISQHIADALPFISADMLVVPIPTATSRIRQRGYDQACIIARSLADIINRQHTPLLIRQGQSRQVGANRKQRLVQLADAYRLVKDVRGVDILLVDDIVTTGATLESAAKILKNAGAHSVSAAIFAQKQ